MTKGEAVLPFPLWCANAVKRLVSRPREVVIEGEDIYIYECLVLLRDIVGDVAAG